jgi:integrase
MTSKRNRGDGGIDQRAPDVWRVRYRMAGKRFTKTVKGTRREAQQELRKLLRSADTGEAVMPDRVTLAQWIERWLAAGAPGRRQKQVGRRSLERYEQLLRCHVVPTLGSRPLQALRADEIDALYLALRGRIAERSIFFLHVCLGACINAAVRQRVLAVSPMQYLGKVPSAVESDHGIALDPEQTRKLVAGFVGHPLYLMVRVALGTGARRNELLALRWSDLNVADKTLRIERSLERTRGRAVTKPPKTRRGLRTIALDDELCGLLLVEREKHLRIAAGVTDATIDLGLIRLPEGALIFPGSPPGDFSFTAFRGQSSVTKVFHQMARKLGFPTLRFHDLRGTAITQMLNAGVPAHKVAARHGHDPAVMLRAYAKAMPQNDADAARVMGDVLKGVL